MKCKALKQKPEVPEPCSQFDISTSSLCPEDCVLPMQGLCLIPLFHSFDSRVAFCIGWETASAILPADMSQRALCAPCCGGVAVTNKSCERNLLFTFAMPSLPLSLSFTSLGWALGYRWKHDPEDTELLDLLPEPQLTCREPLLWQSASKAHLDDFGTCGAADLIA